MKKFHVSKRLQQQAPDGSFVWCLGLRFGWWPCLGGPFVQLHALKWRFEFWYGRPSYKTPQHEGPHRCARCGVSISRERAEHWTRCEACA